MQKLITLITLIINSTCERCFRNQECYDYPSCDYSEYTTYEEIEWCRPSRPRRSCPPPRCCPTALWQPKPNDKCSSSFKQIEFLLGTIEPADTVAVTEAFRNATLKTNAVVDEAYVNSKLELESSKDDLYKEVITCINRNINESAVEILELLNRELIDAQEQLVVAVNAANAAITALITQLATLPAADIALAITTVGSPFQVAVAAAVSAIADANKLILNNIRNEARRAAPVIVSLKKQRVDECIDDGFRRFTNCNNVRFKLLVDNLKSKLNDILKTTETSLIVTLAAVNRRIIEGIRYIINICRETLDGKSSGDAQIAIPLMLPDSGMSSLMN